MTLLLAPIICKYGENIALLSISCEAFVIFLLLLLAIATPMDYTKWNAIIIVLLSVVFTFSLVWSLSYEILRLPQTDIVYSIIIVSVLSLGLLFNIQIIFNEAIFELCPSDHILGALLIFSDIM